MQPKCPVTIFEDIRDQVFFELSAEELIMV